MSKTIENLEEVIQPVLENENIELVDLQYHRGDSTSVLRIFVDKQGGITLDDCQHVSERIGSVLDNVNLIPVDQRYNLEVSSPGLNRILKKESDFVRFCGSKTKIKLYAPLDGQRNFVGYIKKCEGGILNIEDTENKIIDIQMSNIASARLEPEIKF
jgi:ribosome maturation factor RimP